MDKKKKGQTDKNTTQKSKQYKINTNPTKHFHYMFVKVTMQKVGIRSAVSKDGGHRRRVISNYKRKQVVFPSSQYVYRMNMLMSLCS